MKVRQFNICNEVYEILDRAKSLIKEYGFKSITTVELICTILEEETNNLSKFLSEKQIDLEARKKVSKEIMQADKEEYEKFKGQFKEQVESDSLEKIQEEFEVATVLTNPKDKAKYPISEDLLKVLTFVNSKDESKEITSNDLIKALASINLQVLIDVFMLCELDENKAVREFFNYIKLIYYPSTLLQCLKDITAEVDPKSECLILERNQEVRDIYRGLLKAQSNDVVLVGGEGIGKSAVIEKLCWKIVTGNCPEELKNVKIISLDIKSFIAILSLTKEDAVTNVFNDLETFLIFNKDIILYINGANLIDENDVKYGGLSSVVNTIKTIIKRSGVRVIFEATYQMFGVRIDI